MKSPKGKFIRGGRWTVETDIAKAPREYGILEKLTESLSATCHDDSIRVQIGGLTPFGDYMTAVENRLRYLKKVVAEYPEEELPIDKESEESLRMFFKQNPEILYQDITAANGILSAQWKTTRFDILILRFLSLKQVKVSGQSSTKEWHANDLVLLSEDIAESVSPILRRMGFIKTVNPFQGNQQIMMSKQDIPTPFSGEDPGGLIPLEQQEIAFQDFLRGYTSIPPETEEVW